MKTQIALAGVSLSLLGGLVSVSSAEAAGLFSDGDTISGSSGGTGLFVIAGDTEGGTNTDPNALVYFGTTIDTTAPGESVSILGFDYAEITNPANAPLATAETTIGLGAIGGFIHIEDGEFRSFETLPTPESVKDFLVLTGNGLTVNVDIVGDILSSPGVGNAVNFEIPVLVTGTKDGDTQVVDGTFRFTTQNIQDLTELDPNVLDSAKDGEPNYNLDVVVAAGGQSYSWQLDVVKNVPEPSSMVSLLALSALGAGMAMKRKVSK